VASGAGQPPGFTGGRGPAVAQTGSASTVVATAAQLAAVGVLATASALLSTQAASQYSRQPALGGTAASGPVPA
jgi:hypothetical protein